jgi:hypothetical protein
MPITHEQRVAARMQRWFSGDYSDRPELPPLRRGETAELVVLPGADADAINELRLTKRSLVLVPAGERRKFNGAEVLEYEGSLEDELLIDGKLSIRRESYTAAAFVPLTCPTAVAVTSPEDHENFLADADAAVETGRFESFLLHPLAVIADVCALGTETRCAAHQRLRAVADVDGLRPALGGARFTGAEPETGCTACLAAAVEPSALESARVGRPWLTRYFVALECLRALRGRELGPATVLGFGERLSETLPAVPVESSTAPVLIMAGGEHLVCDPYTRRVLRVGRDALRLLEVALATDGGDLVEEVARHMELTTAIAEQAVSDVRRTLDRLGFPLRLGAAA